MYYFWNTCVCTSLSLCLCLCLSLSVLSTIVAPKTGAKDSFHNEEEGEASSFFPWELERKMEGSFSVWILEDYGRKKSNGQILPFFSAPSGKVRKLRRNSDLTPNLGHLRDWTSQTAPTRARGGWLRINMTEKYEWAKRELLLVLQTTLASL